MLKTIFIENLPFGSRKPRLHLAVQTAPGPKPLHLSSVVVSS